MEAQTDVNHHDFWEQIYQHERPQWDIGSPTPVFANWLQERNRLGTGRIAVLGCGNGHDALLFARHGFQVTAVDFAPTPLTVLRREAEHQGLQLDLLQRDCFGLPADFKDYFDFVLEYTSFCAIDPGRRDEYVSVVHQILKPGGYVLALFFPLDDRTGGPPFAIQNEEIDTRFGGHFSNVWDEVPHDSVPKRLGKERFVILKKF